MCTNVFLFIINVADSFVGGEDSEVFRNRKGYFSLNTQVVGDASLKICDCDCLSMAWVNT